MIHSIKNLQPSVAAVKSQLTPLHLDHSLWILHLFLQSHATLVDRLVFWVQISDWIVHLSVSVLSCMLLVRMGLIVEQISVIGILA